MSSPEERIQLIIQRVNELKATVASLKEERKGLENKITQLENELKHKREEETTEMSLEKEVLKEEIGRHIEEIDECLNLLNKI